MAAFPMFLDWLDTSDLQAAIVGAVFFIIYVLICAFYENHDETK